MKLNVRIANVPANCTQTQIQMILKQKTCSSKSATHTKCCQIQKLAAGTTASVMRVSRVLVQVAGQIHSVVAAVLATSLKHSSAVAVAGVIKQVHRVDKTLKSRLA
jgi:hypothetical protein